MKNKIAIFGFLLVMAGCATGGATSEKYQAKLNTWIGASESKLVSARGIPSSRYDLAGGGKVIEYVDKRTVKGSPPLICKTRFTIDDNGIIKGWKTAGNDCITN